MSLPDLSEVARITAEVDEADAAFDRGDHEVAMRLYTDLTASRPRFAYGYYKLGLSQFGAGSAEAAEKSLREAAELGQPAAMVELAGLLADREPEQAMTWLTKAAEAGFRDSDRIAGEGSFEPLRARADFGQFMDRVGQAMHPANSDEKRRAFDFWIGKWRVRTADGRPAGSNRIESILGGAALLENWTSVFGWEGKSITFYNAERECWEQLWIQDDGTARHYVEGQFVDGGLRFHATDDGERRMTFAPAPGGEVRQVGETRPEEGGWTVEYDLIYRRAED